MAYSQTDLESVEAAILALAKGERIVTVSVAGNRVEYGQADLPQLRALRAEIRNDLTANPPLQEKGTRYRYPMKSFKTGTTDRGKIRLDDYQFCFY